MSIPAGRDRRMNAFDHAIAPILPVLLAIAALGCIAGVIRAAAIIPLHVSLDPNEGWNAYHTAAAMSGHGLYPDAGSFMVNNYPPLSFYLVGLLGHFTGDLIIAGRIISLASFVCICGFAAMVDQERSWNVRSGEWRTQLQELVLDRSGIPQPFIHVSAGYPKMQFRSRPRSAARCVHRTEPIASA